MDDFALEELTLAVDIDAGVSNEAYVADDKPSTLMVKQQRDLFKTLARPKDS
jgi:hypothetical protein